MQMITTPQRPFYKGNMHLRVRSHVGVIAFGNAIGNSIVQGLQTKQTVSSNKKVSHKIYEQAVASGNSPKEAIFLAAQAVAQENGGAIELGNSSASRPTGRGSFSYDDADGFWLSNNNDHAFFNYGEGSYADLTLGHISDFLVGSPAADLGYQYATSRLSAKFSRDASFAQGVARGEAMYAAGVRNREQIGVDFSQFNRQVDSYVQFRDAQIGQFKQYYAGLNGGQKFLFNAGSNLFGGLVNGGQALGDATALLGIQGGNEFNSAWSNVGDTLSYVAQNPIDALVVNPATAAYNRYSNVYNTDGFGAAAGTFAGDILSSSVFATLGGGLAPTKFSAATFAPQTINRFEFSGGMPTLNGNFYSPNAVNLRSAEFFQFMVIIRLGEQCQV